MDLGDNIHIDGEMGWRHVEILKHWIRTNILPKSLEGKKILNVGAWTGGETLLLAALGATVDVYEESEVYSKVITYLADQFFLDRVKVKAASVYDLSNFINGTYDIAYLSGVVSHLSDPFVGLRTVFNNLKNNGICLIETQTSYSSDGKDEYWGTNRPGWVWFNLSRLTLLEILKNVGFEDLEIINFEFNRRIQIVGRRNKWKPISKRMGLSYPNIP